MPSEILGLIVEKRKYKNELHFLFRHGVNVCLLFLCGWLSLTSTDCQTMAIPERDFSSGMCDLVAQGLEAPTRGPPGWGGALTLPILLPSTHIQLDLMKFREAGLPS